MGHPTNGMPITGFLNNDETPMLDVYEANSIKSIKASLAYLGEQDTSITSALTRLIASQKEIARELGHLDLLRAHIGSQAVATRSIGKSVLHDAALVATGVSGAVSRLDLEQTRVRITLDAVEQMVELKACVLGVAGSMGAPQDWETAATYLHRASKVPMEIMSGSFAEEIVPTADVPDPPMVTLNRAAESLQGLFLREFDKAAQEGNGGKLTRFFKLFPLIGKPEVGLDVYGRYVCQGVASRARASLDAGTGRVVRLEGFFYANALTKLFEHIAQIIEHHGGLVERHYGVGSMNRVTGRLQLEADVQGGIILDTWNDECDVDRKLTDIKSYAFTFLVRSFFPTHPGLIRTPRAGSPGQRNLSANIHAPKDEDVDMKQVDGILSEIAVMLGRWSLYSKFIAAKCKDPPASLESQEQRLLFPPLLSTSTLNRRIADRLITPFHVMTTFYMRRSIEKAFQMDESSSELSLDPNLSLGSDLPFITSAVDDVMYIVNQIIERSLATSQKAIIASIVPTLVRVLDSDFIGMIQRKMRDESYPKASIQGAPLAEQTIISFLVLMNNLDVASDYVKRIVRSCGETAPSAGFAEYGETASSRLLNLFPLDHDAAFVADALKSLQDSFDGKTSELINDGVYAVFKNVMKPRLRPVIADAFRDVDYHTTKEGLEVLKREAEVDDEEASLLEDTVHYHFQRGWDILTQPVIRILTHRNYEKLLATMVSYLGEILEKRIWSYYGRLDDLGAVRLERDIASIIGIVVKGSQYGMRDTFARCTQICLIMNMENDEWEDFQAVSSAVNNECIDWKLENDERTRARAMVKDSM